VLEAKGSRWPAIVTLVVMVGLAGVGVDRVLYQPPLPPAALPAPTVTRTVYKPMLGPAGWHCPSLKEKK
jgi:hypothetical protein